MIRQLRTWLFVLAGLLLSGAAIAAPPQAAAVGYTVLTFGPSVATTTVATSKPSWYPFGFFGISYPTPLINNSDGSVTIPCYNGTNNNGCFNSNNYAGQMASALPSFTGGTWQSFSGTAFGGGGYFEATLAYSGCFADGTYGIPGAAFWANDVESMNGGSQGDLTARQWPGQPTNYGNWIEVDQLEMNAGGSWVGSISGTTMTVTNLTGGAVGMGNHVNGTGIANGTTVTANQSGNGGTGTYTVSISQNIGSENMFGTVYQHGIGLIDWYGIAPNTQSVNAGAVSGSPAIDPTNTNYCQPHTYGFLWVPATASTQGYMTFYFDNVQVGKKIVWNQWSASETPPPVVGTTAFNVMDNRHLVLILGSGQNAMTVYSVNVWQNSRANDIGPLNGGHVQIVTFQ